MPSQTIEPPAQSSIRNGESSNFPVFPPTASKVSIRRFQPGSGYRPLPVRAAGQRFYASDLTGKFGMVDIRAVKALKRPVTRDAIKANPRLTKMCKLAGR